MPRRSEQSRRVGRAPGELLSHVEQYRQKGRAKASAESGQNDSDPEADAARVAQRRGNFRAASWLSRVRGGGLRSRFQRPPPRARLFGGTYETPSARRGRRKGHCVNLRVRLPSFNRDSHGFRRFAHRRASVNGAPGPVAIIMGSQSDWAVMRRAAETLEALGVAHDSRIVSAHRTPDRLVAFAKGAKNEGFKVIIAGAGGAAHLPGMTAAFTTVPVFGVPIPSKALSGQDSLLSIVQMPAGVPVGTLAIGEAGAVNAALLACAVLALSDEALAARLEAWRAQRTAEVAERPRDDAQKSESAGR